MRLYIFFRFIKADSTEESKEFLTFWIGFPITERTVSNMKKICNFCCCHTLILFDISFVIISEYRKYENYFLIVKTYWLVI